MTSIPTCPAFPFDDPNASHLLRDELTGDLVVIAPGRRYRPDGMNAKRPKDPFAPSSLEGRDIIAKYGRGENAMIVTKNSFPIIHAKGDVHGEQEIIVEGTKIMRFCDASLDRVAALLNAFAERFRALRNDKTVKYIQGFKNEGANAGASQPHPHSQIFALSFVPDRLRAEAKRRREAVRRIKMTTHAYALQLATPDRTIFSDKLVVAYANPTARFAYEVRIMPRRRVDNITQTTPAERRSLAKGLHALLPLMKERNFSYNFFFHDVLDETDEHFEIRFVPRANVWGGFELDAGVVVNPVPAECAAGEYREAKRK